MGIQSLISAAQAAGYAMAPSNEYMDDDDLADEALAVRGGHTEVEHARETLPAIRTAEPVLGTWWRDFLFGWFGGRAAA